MLTKNLPRLLFGLLLFSACKESPGNEKANIIADSVSLPSSAEIQAIRDKFPAAVPFKEGLDSVIDHLNRFGISTKSMLWGQSICVDDITNTKNKLNPEIKGPFNIGGLAGLPFTGVTGLDAFAHHVPEDGTAILFVAPHIGYHEKEGWGMLLRHEQHHPSSCCGALVAALGKLKKGELKKGNPSDDDYQEDVIGQLALTHQDEILSAPDPLIAFTQLTYHEAIRRMSVYAAKLKERHFRYVVVVGGIIINTDYNYPDYLSIENIAIRDLQKNVWVEGAEKLSQDTQDSTKR